MIWNVLAAVIIIMLVYPAIVRGRVGNPACNALDGWIYAHRGCYDTTGNTPVPENSRPAFQRAVEQGVGVELDVHLLADGSLAVIHDSDLERMTARSGVVEELTYNDLAQYHLKGTEETIPTLQEVLHILQGKVPLIIELKVYRQNQDALCQAVCNALQGYTGVYCIESFDPLAVRWFRKHRPDIIRGQLSEKLARETAQVKLTHLEAFGGTYLLMNVLTRPDFVAYKFEDRANLSNQICHGLWGMKGASWTIRSQEDLDTARREDLWPIYEGFKPDTENLKERKDV